MSTTAVRAETREALPDRLRGIALLGIVIVNAVFLGISSNGFTAESVEGVGNRLAALLVATFAQGKFYLLFSFLFGYSAAFILRTNQPPDRKRYLRRMFALFLFGLAHAVFFFAGDILITYAILGVLLLAVSRASDAALRKWTIASVAVSVVLIVGIATLSAAFPEDDAALGSLDAALSTGTFVQASVARFEALPSVLFIVFFLQGPMAFAAFVLGLRASRVRLLADPSANVALWRSCVRWGWGLGLPLAAVSAWLQVGAVAAGTPYSVSGSVGLALGFSSAPILTAGYIGSIALAIIKRPNALAWLAPAGRMSLTVYIGESALLSLVFAGYGLGYFGQWGALPVVVAGIASWAVLSGFAVLWMSRFQRGPLEYLLALMTGKRQTS